MEKLTQNDQISNNKNLKFLNSRFLWWVLVGRQENRMIFKKNEKPSASGIHVAKFG
jgi:hypothetical protein